MLRGAFKNAVKAYGRAMLDHNPQSILLGPAEFALDWMLCLEQK